MGNTFVTPTEVARDAAITLDNYLGVANLVNRDKEAIFTGNKVGDTVKVTVPPSISDASEFTSTTAAADVTETEASLVLEKHFYKRIDLTSKQKSLELSDFNRLITVPAMQGIAQSINKFALRKMQVFRQNLAGTIGNRPSTVAHIVAGAKALNDLKVRKDGRVALIDTTVEASLVQIAQFTSADYGIESPAAVREMSLGRKFGFDWYSDADLGAFVRSAAANDIAGSPVVHVTTAAGASAINIDGVTNATGTIYAGTAFTITGDTTRYVVAADTTAVGNAYTGVEITPVLATQAADGATIAFEAAGYSNILYHPNAVSMAVVAPAPLAIGSVVQAYNGVQVRVTQDSSISTLADSIVFDLFVACRVINPKGGCLVAG
jgi:hypothetical protein